MARENQGMNALLIVFITLTVILAATTFWFLSRSQEARKEADQAAQKEQQATNSLRSSVEENNKLKTILGVSSTDGIQQVEQRFDEDKANYGGTFPEDQRFYRPLLIQTYNALQERSADLATAQADLKKAHDEYKANEARIEGQMNQYRDEAEKHNKDLLAERRTFTADRQRALDEQTRLQVALETERKAHVDEVADVKHKLDELGGEYNKLRQLFDRQEEKIETLVADTVEIPDGQVAYVNQLEGKVWVSVGSADSVNPQTTFAVYDQDATNLAKATKKASLEITAVKGPHLSEARVLDDDPRRPITPGDKIETPVWSPNEKRHFAIVGFIDIDDDGRSDLDLVRELIQSHGGVVDAWMAPGGERSGDITIDTRYLVKGKEPVIGEGEVNQKDIDNNTAMYQEAERYRLEQISAQELLNRMGWKNRTPMITYGRGGNPADFRAKPPEGVVPTSRGNVSELFQPRNPPRDANH